MRRIPPILATSPIPVIVTCHGVKAFSLPLEEIIFGTEDLRYILELKAALVQDWRWLSAKASAVIAVSRYAAEEAQAAFNLDDSLIHIVHNGVDRSIFTPHGERELGPYFLAVSNSNPIKNLARIITAYSQLPRNGRPSLVVVAPELSARVSVEGARTIHREISQGELACWYRGATALVFPSLRETFGLPIIEAMACGCPVITSRETACAEVAGDAALLVDPRSTDDIAEKMRRIAADQTLRNNLSAKGIERSSIYSWRESAERLLEIFESIIRKQGKSALTQCVGTVDTRQRSLP
jgi:glycosyltransferase involved in cell wall biosynthesis